MPAELPGSLNYGKVIGRLVLAVGDATDVGSLPDAVPATGNVVFVPITPITRETTAVPPATVIRAKIPCGINTSGELLDPQGNVGVWLITGLYRVDYELNEKVVHPHDILVTVDHTEEEPLDLTQAMPPGGPVLSPSEYATLTARIDNITIETATDHGDLSNLDNDDHPQYALTDGSRGEFASKSQGEKADSALQAPALNNYVQTTDSRLSDARPPTPHSHTAAAVGADPAGTAAGLISALVIPNSPDDIGAATAAQGAKADTAVQPAALSAATAGLQADINTRQTAAQVDSRVQQVVGAAPAALDTLVEIAARLESEATDLDALIVTVSGKASAAQGAKADSAVQPSDLVPYVQTTDSRLSDARPPTTHNHDDRYFTETESDARFATTTQGTKADSALQQATPQPINIQTGTTYTLAAGDANGMVQHTNAAASTLTVPSGVFSAGHRVDVYVLGTGMLTVIGDGVTVTPEADMSLISAVQGSAFTIYFLSPNVARVTGRMAPA